MLPLFGIAGNMGAGKSTIAKVLVDKYSFLEVTQAAPIKELAQTLFDFDSDALYGPTEERNKLLTEGPWTNPLFFPALNLAQEMAMANILTAVEAESKRVRDICADATTLLENFYKKEGGLTARYVLQILGTEVGRTIRQTLWTERSINYALEQLAVNCEGVIPVDAVVISDVRFRSELLTIKRAGGTIIKVVDPNAKPPPADEHVSESELRGIPDFWFDAIWYNEKSGSEKLEESIKEVMLASYYITQKVRK